MDIVQSDKFKAGRRTYFFDIKETSQGIKCLCISESKKEGETFKRHRIMIFEENLLEFQKVLNDLVDDLDIDPNLKERLDNMHPSDHQI